MVSGIGFLAGGSILRSGVTVQGLTTAAGLWLVTAIGLCAGAGMYAEAGAVTVFGVLALTTLRRFENKDDKHVRRRIALVLGEDSPGVAAIVTALNDLGATSRARDRITVRESESGCDPVRSQRAIRG